MDTTRILKLRHTLSPSMFLIVIISGFDAFIIVDMVQHGFYWNVFGTMLVLSACFAFMISLNFFYTISWNGSEIIQTAFGLRKVSIRPQDITTLKSEVSDTRTLFKANRPFRRIAIYNRNKFIDVSLKHFKMCDIRTLMDIIHEIRPDLPMSKLPKSVMGPR